MKKAHCEVCLREIEVADTYDEWRQAAICRPDGQRKPLCAIVLSLFNSHWSDEAVAQREYFDSQKRLSKR